jgi:transglutaminase-like putative cysteine protease
MDDGEFVELLVETTNPNAFDGMIGHYVNYLKWKADNSLSQGKPNYRIHARPMLQRIGESIGRPVDIGFGFDTIEGFVKKKDDDVLQANYVKAIVQPYGSSFTYDDTLEAEANRIVLGSTDDIEKSHRIFRWIRSNIDYDKNRLGNYRGALQTYNERKGVCGESAALQVTMERLTGEKSYLAEIGEKHAVAAHLRPNGKVILIETTNDSGFDVKYPDYKIITDEMSFARYS